MKIIKTYLLARIQDSGRVNRRNILSCYHIDCFRPLVRRSSETRHFDGSCCKRTWNNRWSRSRGYHWSRHIQCRSRWVRLLAGKRSRPRTIMSLNSSS